MKRPQLSERIESNIIIIEKEQRDRAIKNILSLKGSNSINWFCEECCVSSSYIYRLMNKNIDFNTTIRIINLIKLRFGIDIFNDTL